MAVRTKCLVAPQSVPTGPSVIYTVPAGETTIVKFVALVNSGATDRNVSIYVDSGSGRVRVGLIAVLAQTDTQLEVWWVLQPGWVLEWGASSGVVGSLHGTELEGVAD